MQLGDERADRRRTSAWSRAHPGLEPGQLEQVGDEPAQALGLGEGAVEVLGVGRHDPVREVLQHGDHRGQRRAQLVRDGGDQVAALGVDQGQVAGHLVEDRGQPADLVGGGVWTRPE